jgi:hypothetical protein
VGYQVGAALRAGQSRPPTPVDSGTHAAPRPHWRRAHWHLFWRGPRAGPRTQVLHWLPPLPIAGAGIVPTVRLVRGLRRPPPSPASD